MKNFYGLMILLLAVSCGKGGGGSSQPVPMKTEDQISESAQESEVVIETPTLLITKERKVDFKADFSNYEDFKENINRYNIRFEAKSGHFIGAKVECAKDIFDQRNYRPSTHFDKNGQVAEIEIELFPTDPSRVQVICSVFSEEMLLEKETIELTKSYVVTGEKNFQAFINTSHIETLLIDENSYLVTSGENIELKIKQLISKGGKIITHDQQKNQALIDNRPGQDGGKIYLKVSEAFGKVAFELRGLNGGKQTLIPEAMKDIPKADPALDGKCKTSWGREEPRHDPSCAGKPGHTGFPGLMGFPGLNGGNTGSLELTVLNETDLSVSVLHFPGEGSYGGKGGQGGVGGPGGKGLTVTWTDMPDTHGCARCTPVMKGLMAGHSRKYPDGAQGPVGPQGKDGVNGVPGIIEGSMLTLGSKEFFIQQDFNL